MMTRKLNNLDIACLYLFVNPRARQVAVRKAMFNWRHGGTEKEKEWHRGWYCEYFRGAFTSYLGRVVEHFPGASSYLGRDGLWQRTDDDKGIVLTLHGMKRVHELMTTFGSEELCKIAKDFDTIKV